MIVVYAEQIILDNMCVDCVLMFATCKILGIRYTWWRLLLVGAIGSVAALLAGYFGGWVAWTAKTITAPLMVLLVGKHINAKKYFLALGLMLGLTFMYGGACYLALDWIGLKTMRHIPIGFLSGCVCILGMLSVGLFRRVRRVCRQKKYIYTYAVTVNGARVEAKGYLDSGNTLSCRGLPVVIMDLSLLQIILGKNGASDLLLERAPSGFNGEWIECATIKGMGKIFVFHPDKFEIYSDKHKNILFDVMIGIHSVHPIADCKTLLNYEMEANS